MHTRIIAALGVLLLVFGVVTQFIVMSGTMTCVYEVHQKMHADLAENLVRTWKRSGGGPLTPERLGELFGDVMKANPQLSIYILDLLGGITCSSVPKGSLKMQRVDLQPIHSFLSGTAQLPIYGSDPRSERDKCLFSTAEIREGDSTTGYFYVLLESPGGKSVGALISESNVMWISMAATVGGVIIFLAIGGLLIASSTSRLRRLARQMEEFRSSGFLRPGAITGVGKSRKHDEVDKLQQVSSEMAERIAGQMRELRRAGAFRRELVTNLGHDLRTPLSSLQGYLENIRLKHETIEPEKRRQYIEVALANARRLAEIVEEMNMLSALDSGAAGLNEEAVTIQDLLHDVLHARSESIAQRGVRLHTEIAGDIRDIRGDTYMLNRALSNITEHVLHHVSNGGEVKIGLVDYDECVEISFIDPDRVAADDELEQYFEQFHQEQGNPEAKGGGAGMAIANRIISLHGGMIRIERIGGAGVAIKVLLSRS